MNIRIEYTAQLKQVSQRASEELMLPAGSCAQDAIMEVAAMHGDKLAGMLLADDGAVSSALLFFIRDEQVVDLESFLLNDGDCLTMMSPISGG